MEWLANFHFIRPGWLPLLPVAIGVWWFWQQSVQPLRGWREQIDPELLKAMMDEQTRQRDYAPHSVLAGWMIAIVAIAGPTWRQEPNPFAADAAPLMVLLKADKSMERPGSSPSALERAKLKIADLAKARKGQPLGLIAYAGSAHLVLPPTNDTSIVAEMAAEISPEIMPKPGDRVDLAIRKAGEILAGEDSGGTLLIIADSFAGEPQSVQKALEDAGAYPLQVLALEENDSMKSLARLTHATVIEPTPDDQDMDEIVKGAERKSVVGIAGESERWQEAGYWLVPLLAFLVAVSFRREEKSPSGGQP